MKVLCLDIEGGFGGSSKSLFESLRHMDREAIDATVWCKKEGPIKPQYEKEGIAVEVTSGMPKVTAVPKFSRNFVLHGLFLKDWIKASGFRRKLLKALPEYDVIHLNHESLFWLALWLKRKTGKPVTMHIRTRVPPNWIGRLQYWLIAKTLDELIYITENEQTWLNKLSGRNPKGTVIYNIVSQKADEPAHKRVPIDSRFKVASLSNCDWVRGTDRVVSLAAAIKEKGRSDILFVMAGSMQLGGNPKGELGDVRRKGGNLEDYAKVKGVEDMVLFLGHVKDPERVLSSCDALAKLTREANPWARDIIEALGAGCPVLSLGTYNTFVDHGKTGILLETYSDQAMADEVIKLADDRECARHLGVNARERVAQLCNGRDRAADLLAVWNRLVSK